MIRKVIMTWMCGILVLSAAESGDLLRFMNGDQLHGEFQGINQNHEAIWKRDDVSTPVHFKTSQLRHIILNGAIPAKSLTSLSHISLVNGDRVPGSITELNDDFVILETPFSGILKFPRDQVAMLAPSPLGGRMNYYGPFIEEEWKMVHPSYSGGMPAVEGNAKNSKDQPGRWVFSGSAWYWSNKGIGTALLKENSMPDQSILRFELAWKNRLSLAMGFHADFAKPKEKEANHDENQPQVRRQISPRDSSVLPMIFGNSYVIQIYSSHLMLFRTSIEEDGSPKVQSIQTNGNLVRLGESGKAQVEIRSNRKTGQISLFINGEFALQWQEIAGDNKEDLKYAGKGSGFGFVAQSEDTAVKISEIMVAEWNGMPDSARSLQVQEQDIVLLANGTDRFSGRVTSLQDKKLKFDGKYGEFNFLLDDIAEIRFARNRLAKDIEASKANLTVRLSPLGQITGQPISGNDSSLLLNSPIFGEVNVSLESAVMLDFQPSNNIIDDWDANF
ncbi:MAG: hypothetical protein HC845_02600 [Akkermansiaceae bacterium]|nr:hypothetical protein [Akkermansiaceae bacterium]